MRQPPCLCSKNGQPVIIFIYLFFFFCRCPPADRNLDDLVSDEAMDCQIIELLCTEVLPFSSSIPKDFIVKVVVLLNRGSIHSATNTNIDSEIELTLREEFAKTCFETLLQFSLIDGENEAVVIGSNDNEGGVAGKLAVTALLHRFQEVLKKYIDDEKHSGKCPLPRYYMCASIHIRSSINQNNVIQVYFDLFKLLLLTASLISQTNASNSYTISIIPAINFLICYPAKLSKSGVL